jgi:hypothetical protein
LLSAIDAGDPNASDRLLPLVYEELRKLAVVRMAERPKTDENELNFHRPRRPRSNHHHNTAS